MEKNKKNEMQINVNLSKESVAKLAKAMDKSKEVTLSDETIRKIADAMSDNIIFGMEHLLKPIYDEVKNITSEVESISASVNLL